MAIVNIGILAHVDAGKTTLTERILFETGVIRTPGSVDRGTTQTDTLELERARGITIKAAVASFQLHDLKVNLIDTPGHADFIAEVERSLRVLDGVVLVISAVEGVQPQTRRLARAILAAGLPIIVFVNKVDRLGARGDALLDDIRGTLGLRPVAMTAVNGAGGRDAVIVPRDRDDAAWRDAAIDILAETSERMIAEFERTGGRVARPVLERELRSQVAQGLIVPVFFGSAITGAGVPKLLAGVEEWLPPAAELTEEPVAGTMFKINRQSSGEKLVYARLTSGRLSVRDRVELHRRTAYGEIEQSEERITAIDGVGLAAGAPVREVSAGDIAVIHGLRSARIGDWLGPENAHSRDDVPAFPAPALESVVTPVDATAITRLRSALEMLAEADPLISLRQRNDEGEISIRLYGDIQKEVVAETLARDFGLAVNLGPSRTICIERPVGTGHFQMAMGDEGNPFWATVGFSVEPAATENGLRYERELGSLPLAFYRAIEETIHETLAHGVFGWEVTDIRVRLTHAGFSSVLSTAGDFRKLTPYVLMQTLLAAGTVVCEPIELLDIEIPEGSFGAVCGLLVAARATLRDVARDGESHRLAATVPTAELRAVERQLPGLTRGECDWTTAPAGYVPIEGEPPERPRTGPDPRHHAHYLAEVARS